MERLPVGAMAAATDTSGFSPAWRTRKIFMITGSLPPWASMMTEVLDCSPLSTVAVRSAGASPSAATRRARAEGTSCSAHMCCRSVWAKTGSWVAS